MCDVPSIAVFCSESIEYLPGTVSKFFLKLLVTIPVAPIITGTIVHFRFHIRLLLLLLLYFSTVSLKGHDFLNSVIEHYVCVLIFSAKFVSKICHSKKN